MKLLFRQRVFSWLDSYDIYDERNNTVFSVVGRVSWGHKLEIHDAAGNVIGVLKERIISFLPTFDFIAANGNCIGSVKKELTLFKPRYVVDFLGWQVNGNFLGWNYSITDSYGASVADISKRVISWSDTYELNIHNPEAALYVVMTVLAIDAAICSSKD